MSKTRYKWYYTAKDIARQSMRGEITSCTQMGKHINDCVEDVCRRTAKRADGKERIGVITETIKYDRRYVAGVALKLHISERTVVQYTSDFVYEVAKKIGLWE